MEAKANSKPSDAVAIVGHGVEVIKVAMEGAPPWLRAVELITGVLALVALFLSYQFAKYGQDLSALVVAIVGLALLLVVILLLFGFGSRLSPQQLPPPIWTNSVPQLPLKPEVSIQLKLLLQDIRKKAFDILGSIDPDLQDRHIRANVFVPDSNEAGKGIPCVLRIPPDLHINMTHPPELEVNFRPGDGATGRAYYRGSRQTARRTSVDPSGWSEIFPLTDEQRKMIHKDLQWVVSSPLQDANARTIGVLNIDCLHRDFTDDQLNTMAVALSGDIRAFGLELMKQPQLSITIRAERSV